VGPAVRLYGKRFLKNTLRSAAYARNDFRDAIVWEINSSQRYARVKIQGSNELIVAYYPDAWGHTPDWLSEGRAVKIAHTCGTVGRIEVVGRILHPSPVSGEILPPIATGTDCVLSGCELRAIPNGARMAVQVLTGTYRISGTQYALGPISMLYGDAYKMGDGGAMETVAGVVAINAAPSSGSFRYDLVCVGADGFIDYVPGTASATPAIPSLPGSHVQIGKQILVSGGATEITGADIGREYQAPAPATVTVTPADADLAWSELSTTIVVQILDQYGNGIGQVGNGWYITLEIAAGNGTVSSSEEGSSTAKIGMHAGANQARRRSPTPGISWQRTPLPCSKRSWKSTMRCTVTERSSSAMRPEIQCEEEGVNTEVEQLLSEIRGEMKAQTTLLLEMAATLKKLSDHSARASEEMGQRLKDTASLLKGTPFEGMARNLMTAAKE